MLISALAVLGIVAVALIVIGLRGRRVDEEPTCRACRYSLLGVPEETKACPECGAVLSRRRAIRLGRRRRRPMVLAAGIVLLLAGAGGAGFQGWKAQTGFDWNRVKPVWMLRRDATGADPGAADAALVELVRRLQKSRLLRGEVEELVTHGLDLQGDPLASWNPRWSEIVEGGWRQGLVDDEHLKRYLRQGVSVATSVRAKERVRSGAHLTLLLDVGPGRFSEELTEPWGKPAGTDVFKLRTEFWSLEAPGLETIDLHGASTTGPLPSASGTTTFSGGSTLDLEPGLWELTIVCALRIRRGEPGSEFHLDGPDVETMCDWKMQFPITVEVVPEDAPVVAALDEPDLARAIRASIRLDLNHDSVVHQGGSSHHEGHYGFVSIEETPTDLAFELLCRHDGVEKRCGSISSPRGQSRSTWFYPMPLELFPEAETVDLVLRSSAEVAERSMADFQFFWEGEIVFTDVPVVPVVFEDVSRAVQEAEIRRCLAVKARVNQWFTEVEARCALSRDLPTDLAFDVVCVVEGVEHPVGWLAGTRDGSCTSNRNTLEAGTVEPDVETVDVILRPNPSHLDPDAAPWSDEIVFENVPVEREGG